MALFVSLVLCLITAAFLFYFGKTGSFLIINQHYTPALDVVFRYGTYLGDGLIYIPLLAYCFFFNRRFTVPAALSIVICLALTQFLKHLVFPDALRPVSLEARGIVLHKINGVYMNRLNSFPSGHTATAFATALVLATVLRKRLYAAVLPVVAFFVGYARVYLAQHFVSDVLGGMLIGISTALLSLWLYALLEHKLPQALRRE